MTVTNIWAGKDIPLKVKDEAYKFSEYFNNDKHIELISQAIACNVPIEDKIDKIPATDLSLIKMLMKFGVNLE